MKHILPSIVIAVAVFAAIPARAQSPAADFKAAYERGMAYFNAKELAKARTEFLAAYAMQAEPTVLFAIAQTYRFEGNYKEAIAWYQKFLADSKAAQDLRTEAQTYLVEAEARQKALDEAKRSAAEAGPKEVNGKPATMPDSTTTTPVRTANPPDAIRKRNVPLGSKIAAGVTGAGLVTSLVLTKLGLDAEKDFKDLRDRDMATQTDSDRVERYQNLINISWGVTAAAAITTVAIYFVAPRYTTDRQIAITPSHDGVSVSLHTRF